MTSDRISQQFQHLPNASFTNETLVRHGFLGATPDKPVLAISIELLEIYRQLRRVCPWLSLDAFARALCHIHHVGIVSFYAPMLTYIPSYRANHISQIRSALLTTAILKSSATSKQGNQKLLDEAPTGSSRMSAPLVSIELPMNHRSNSASWLPWMATTHSSSWTAHSTLVLSGMTIVLLWRRTGSQQKVSMSTKMRSTER